GRSRQRRGRRSRRRRRPCCAPAGTSGTGRGGCMGWCPSRYPKQRRESGRKQAGRRGRGRGSRRQGETWHGSLGSPRLGGELRSSLRMVGEGGYHWLLIWTTPLSASLPLPLTSLFV